MNIVTVSGIAVLCCAASVIIKKFGDSASVLVPAAAAVCLTATAVIEFSPVGEYLKTLDGGGELSKYVSYVIKGAGIAVLGECASDICRDCGESSIAGGVELCTKAAIMTVSLPLISELIELSKGLMEN